MYPLNSTIDLSTALLRAQREEENKAASLLLLYPKRALAELERLHVLPGDIQDERVREFYELSLVYRAEINKQPSIDKEMEFLIIKALEAGFWRDVLIWLTEVPAPTGRNRMEDAISEMNRIGITEEVVIELQERVKTWLEE